MRRLFVPLGLLLLCVSPAIADPALLAKPTILRATASSHGKVIQALQSNAQIDVNNCGKTWCFVSWRDKFGYVPVSVVAALPEAQPRADAYPPPGPAVGAPYYGGPYLEPYGVFDYGYGYGRGYGGGWGHRH
jgi:hypothetical protein